MREDMQAIHERVGVGVCVCVCVCVGGGGGGGGVRGELLQNRNILL